MSVTPEELEAALAQATTYTDDVGKYVYIMLTAFCIFFMQAGFALLEAGGCRSKNAKSILYKNAIDLSIGVLMWWFWGYDFALASDGSTRNASRDFSDGDALNFLITVAFCTTAATIVSGAVAERINIWVYVMSTVAVAGASYPLIAQWMWTAHNPNWKGSGWFLDKGVIDFAGSGVVHLLGATAAFVTALMVGPREGRFTKNADGSFTVNPMPPYDPVLMTIGTWILVFGWLSFNGSSSGGYGLGSLEVSARAVVMTVIGMASGALMCTLIQLVNGFVFGAKKELSLTALNNAFLGSLVAVTAPCSTCDSVGAFFIGSIGGLLAYYGQNIPYYFGVDDPLDTFSVHGLNGAWGLISVGLFAKKEFVSGEHFGCFYGGDGYLLSYQIAAAVVIIIVSASISLVALCTLYVFGTYVLRMKENVLRVKPEHEITGLDIGEFEGYVYPENTAMVEKLTRAAGAQHGTRSADAAEKGVALGTVRNA
jgi:Amt family ammonium transporter